MLPSAQQVFSDIYATNRWLFGSGAGSLPSATVEYRDFLQKFIAYNSISSVVDFGCGDWQSSSLVNWTGICYYGIDIVPNLIAENNEKFGIPDRVTFSCTNEHLLDLPDADLLVAKDVLQHWPNACIHHFLQVLLPRYRFALITNCCWPQDLANQDIPMGGWRPLRLNRDPFCCGGAVIFRFSGIAPEPVNARWEKETLLIARG